MILIDALEPAEWLEPGAKQVRQLGGGVRMARRTAWLAQFGLMRFYLWLVSRRVVQPDAPGDWVASFRKLPRELLPTVRTFWSQPKSFRALADQIESLPESSAQVAATGGLGHIPLVVLSAGNASPVRLKGHQCAAQLSTRGVHIVAHQSGHWIQLDQPQLVVAAIRQVIEACRPQSASPMPAATEHQAGGSTKSVWRRDTFSGLQAS